MPDINDLRFIRIYDFHLIPEHLLKQVRDLGYPPERLYMLGEAIMKNPFALLYALADQEHKIQGVLWATINPLDEIMYVQLLSMDRSFQNRGQAITVTIENLEKIRENMNLNGIRWLTTRPRAFEKHGFKRSKRILMEV